MALPRGATIRYDAGVLDTRVRKVIVPSAQEASEFLKWFGDTKKRPDEIEFNDPKEVVTREQIAGLGRWPVITLPEGMEGLCTRDQVMYTADGEELVRYPQALGLDHLTVPEGVTRIGCEAFQGCEKLKSLTLPTTLKEIEERALSEMQLEKLVLPEGLLILRKEALSRCHVPEIVLPRSVKVLEEGCLYGAHAVRLSGAQVPLLTQALGWTKRKLGKTAKDWKEVRLDIVSEEGGKVTTWWIPGYGEKIRGNFEKLFVPGGLNLDSYFAMVKETSGPHKGQMLFSLSQVMEGKTREDLLGVLRKTWASRLGKEMIGSGNLEDFRKLLELDILSERAKKELLGLCDSQEGRVAFAAYLMEAGKGQGKKKFSL